MGMISNVLGLGPAIGNVAEVFVENRTKRAAHDHAEQLAALNQLGAEYAAPKQGWFDGLVNGLNRLPRPAMALGTMCLFGFAMADPVAFGIRMQGLALVPEPLWWLLGAVVSFYFGARELHHFRGPKASVSPEAVSQTVARIAEMRHAESQAQRPATEPTQDRVAQALSDNAAVQAWRQHA